MILRLAAIGLLAGTFLAVSALATDQRATGQPQVSADAQSGSGETSDTTEAASAHAEPANAHDTADASDATADVAPDAPVAAEGASEASATEPEESAASAEPAPMDIVTEKAKPFDPNKAKPKQIEAYNATVEPDDRIVCRRDRDSAATGARFSVKLCRTVRQWRELGR